MALVGETLRLGSITVELSRTGRVLFPDDDITKGDLIDHYLRVAELMLPLLRDRPVSLMRYPDGITTARIVQKNLPPHFPDWITRARVHKEGGWVQYVVCDQPATLVYLANQACVELHTFLSRLDRMGHPEEMIIDLDAPDESHFPDVRLCALRLRHLLEDELGLAAFVKTTGGSGLHLHVPLQARDDSDSVREFAHRVCDVLAGRNPGFFTTEPRRSKRGGRIYLDVMRNAYAQTVIAPYSVRALPGAPVAAPLYWEELGDSRLSPRQFTIRTLPGRIAALRTEDPWLNLAKRRSTLAPARDVLRQLAA